jgi:NDP-sugar pyrophosphorylase family protein
MKAMILTAGVGSRLKQLTENTPKALVKIGEHRMLDLAIAYLQKHGVDEFIINVHHLADQLMEYVAAKRWEGYNISISDETNELLNTGGGLKKAAPFFKEDEDFVLMAVDILTDLDLSGMIATHKQSDALVSLAVKERKTSRNLMFDADGNLAGWRHNESGETKIVAGRQQLIGYGFSGIHVINQRIFSLIKEVGPFSIIDLYLRLASTEAIKMFDHSNGRWMEFGRVEKISEQTTSEEFKSLLASLNI